MKEIAKKVKLVEPIDVNSIAIKRDHYFPNAYIIDLPLDSMPDHVWQDICEREWKSSRHLWDRKIFVIGDKLRLVSTPYDIEDKLDWIKQVIERTNSCIDEYVKEAEARVLQAQEQAKTQVPVEESTVESIRNSLRRRLGAY